MHGENAVLLRIVLPVKTLEHAFKAEVGDMATTCDSNSMATSRCCRYKANVSELVLGRQLRNRMPRVEFRR